MKRWLWPLAGVALGLALGLGYSWVVHPAQFNGAEPTTLRPDYRGEYILLIAAAYEADGDLGRARDRLALFPELNPDSLATLAQQVVAAQGASSGARGLAELSVALREAPALPTEGALAAAGFSPTVRRPATLEPTLALTIPLLPQPTTRPTALSTPTPIPQFSLLEKEPLCESAAPGLLEVVVQTTAGTGVAGVVIRVQWPGGEGRMVTGMKPELGAGYADYAIEPDVSYQVAPGNGLTSVGNLVASECAGAESNFLGGWHLVFEVR